MIFLPTLRYQQASAEKGKNLLYRMSVMNGRPVMQYKRSQRADLQFVKNITRRGSEPAKFYANKHVNFDKKHDKNQQKIIKTVKKKLVTCINCNKFMSPA